MKLLYMVAFLGVVLEWRNFSTLGRSFCTVILCAVAFIIYVLEKYDKEDKRHGN